MNNIKVLHFYKTAIPSTIGGVEVFMDTLCDTTADLGVNSTILALSKDPAPNVVAMPKYKLVQAKQNFFIASTGFSFSVVSKFRRLAAAADIIHYHFPNPFADILHVANQIKKPSVVTYHSDIIKQKHLLKIYNPLMHKFLAATDKIIATSENYFNTSAVLQKYADKVEIIPVGLDTKNLSALNPERVAYWQQRLPADFFLFVGALRYYKGLYTALDAIKGTNLQLAIAGSGGIENELKNYARQHGISNAHFVGNISEQDKVALHHLSKAFVFPSHLRSEAFGLSLVEAAALKKPMISCEIGTGTSFINVDQLTGFVIRPEAAPELRAAMHRLLECPDTATQFGINAQQRYLDLFTATKQAESYVNVYRQLLSR